MEHGLGGAEVDRREKLLELAKKTGVPLVATNDCHYLSRTDAAAARPRCCASAFELDVGVSRASLPALAPKSSITSPLR